MENNDGSLFKVPLTKILAINPHGNAERLEVATVYGFQVIVGKGQYQVGDRVVYVPIDSVIDNQELEDLLFPPDSKIKLNNHRVRQIKIRGLASQGMLINPKDIEDFANWELKDLEDDLAYDLGVVKYEPPVSGPASTVGKDKQRNKKYEHPLFHKYNGVSNIKWFPNIFDGYDVVIQEKLHGTNARAGVLPFVPRTLFDRIKNWLGLAPKTQSVYGSNNVDISAKEASYKGYYEDNVYGDVFKKMDVFSKVRLGEIVYGEIVGPGLQKNYDYGLKECKFVLFDVKVLQPDGTFMWLDPKQVDNYAHQRGFDFVPVLYVGPWDKDKAYELSKGPSVYAPSQKVREGIVIKRSYEYNNEGNKTAFKFINEDYLADKNNTDNH